MKVDGLQSGKEQRVIDSQKKSRAFQEEQEVFVQIDDKKNWVAAKVIRRHNETSNVYDLKYQGRVVKKHADKMKPNT